MPFNTPQFWYKAESWQASALSPLACIYGILSKHRIKQRAKYAANSKVICIGNLTAGGSGKTPTAIAIAGLAGSPNTVFLSRGYGGSVKGPELVNIDHSSLDVGDEPLLLARVAPTLVSQDRIEGAKLAEQHNAKLIIMDDGLQNPNLYKDIRICVIDGPTAFGNMQCIPSGPLRQPLATGLTQVDAFIIIGDMDKSVQKLLPKAIPQFQASIVPDTSALPHEHKVTEYLAFCGLAHPRKFIKTLKDINANVIEAKFFADHHKYTVKELKALYEYAMQVDARMITTEKDLVRIPNGPWMDKIDVLPIVLKFKKEASIKKFLKEGLSGEL